MATTPVKKITCQDLANALMDKIPIINDDMIRNNLVYTGILPYWRVGNGPYYLKPEGFRYPQFMKYLNITLADVQDLERRLGVNFKQIGRNVQVA